MVQATAEMLKGGKSKSPPSSSSSNDSEGFLSRNARRGFRLAEFALNTAITGANLTMALSDALVDLTSAPHQSSEEEAVNNPEVISVQSSPPQTINSSSSDVEEIPPPYTNIIFIIIKTNPIIHTSTNLPSIIKSK